MKEVTLPSGAILKIDLAPFEDAKALFQVSLEEMKEVSLDPNANVDVNLFKNVFCYGLSSKKLEACIWKCMERALYNDLKMDKKTFEPVEARGDYLQVCFEIMEENLKPFSKSLFAQFARAQAALENLPA